MKGHKHRAVRRSDDRCYVSCVNPRHCKPRAHGNIEFTEYCRCGAWRLVVSNNFVREFGEWYEEVQ
jgi:hypothetical protein